MRLTYFPASEPTTPCVARNICDDYNSRMFKCVHSQLLNVSGAMREGGARLSSV